MQSWIKVMCVSQCIHEAFLGDVGWHCMLLSLDLSYGVRFRSENEMRMGGRDWNS